MGGCVASVYERNSKNGEKPIRAYEKVRGMGLQSREIGAARPGEGRIRRSASCENIDIFSYGTIHPCLLQWVQSSCQKFSNRNAIAYRPWGKEEKGTLTDEATGKTREWTYINLKPTEYISYAQFWDQVTRVGAGLAERGLSGQNVRIGLYEDTRYEWMIAMYGMWTQATVGVTVYANLGDDALAYAIRESEINAIFLGAKSIKNLVKLGDISSLKYIISFDEVPANTQLPPHVELVLFSDLLKAAPCTPAFPSGSDVALIMYTSGTTGDPKGVVMSHTNLVASVQSLERRLIPALGQVPEPDEHYVAYLPLAHVLELTAENIMFTRGSTVCYGNARTLTNTSARPHGDLQEYKPTIFAGVPRIYDTIKKVVESRYPPKGSLKREVLDRAYEDRRRALSEGKDTPYWNKEVFSAFKPVFGGKVKMLVSGGAPLNGATQEFLTVIFGVSVQQGYGLTETCALATCQRFYDMQRENVGGVVSGCEIKLRDAMNYTSSKNPPEGEVLIRGPNVTMGYFKQKEKTDEVFLQDGWFATGDVGQWQRDGTLRIVGRVKALAKNCHGEYIAMEALEATYTGNDIVLPNGICVVVDPHQPFIGAIILTDEKKAMDFAEANGLSGEWPSILQTNDFRQKVIDSLALTAKAAKKKPFEFIKQVRVFGDEWTPENGILTAAMKLKRREIDTKYAGAIKEMFSVNAAASPM
eukprot:PhF_6_TR5557/c0_g1_i1/m.7936/K01897/ACSL, fadD; long-chain acyl-CoA synthetase